MKKITALLLALTLLTGCVSAMGEAADTGLPQLVSTWILIASMDTDGNFTDLSPGEENDLYMISFYEDRSYDIPTDGPSAYGGYVEDEIDGLKTFYLFPIDTETGKASQEPDKVCIFLDSDAMCIPREAEDGSILYLYFALYEDDAENAE